MRLNSAFADTGLMRYSLTPASRAWNTCFGSANAVIMMIGRNEFGLFSSLRSRLTRSMPATGFICQLTMARSGILSPMIL